MSHLNDFIDAMRADGFEPARPSDVREGLESVLIQARDDKKGQKKLYVTFKIDGARASGRWWHCGEGRGGYWQSDKASDYSAEDRARWKAEREAEEKARKEAEHKKHAEAADEAKRIWKEASAAIEHPYLKKKGIGAHGLRIDAEGSLILPRYDWAGKLWSVQTIGAAPPFDKKFQYGGKASGLYYPIADKDDDKAILCIVEGFATGASIREATGFPVLVAYTAGGLLDVAKGARRKYPASQIIVCADNDAFSFASPRAEAVRDIDKADITGDDPRWNQWREAGYLNNTGIEKGKEAAFAVDGACVWPEFKTEDLEKKPTDWNDYHKLYGAFRIKEIIERAINRPKEVLTADYVADDYHVNMVPDYDPGIDWLGLVRWKDERKGELHKDFALHNAEVLLTHKRPVGGCLCYDEFLNKMTVIRPLPWEDAKGFTVRELDSQDINRLRIWLEGEGIRLNKGCVKDVAELACMNNGINPAVEYINSLTWDKKPRLNKWLSYYLGAEEQPHDYLARVGSCWLMAAVKRILWPGTPFHHMLVLEGGQGALKSTTLATLATFGKDAPKAYFSDGITFEMIDRHDFASYADGNVILEFQELTGMGKKDRNKVKQWITQTTDEYRKPHDPVPTRFPRKFVLAGTTNDSQYLNDPTGDRRFWPVKVGKIDIAALKADKEQLWAEAAHRAKAGELWYIEPDDPVYKMMQNEQSVRYVGDPWDGIIEDYIKNLQAVTIEEIFKEVLHLERSKWDPISKSRVCNIITKAGFENRVTWCGITKKSIRKWARPDAKSNLFEEEIAFD